MTIEDNEFVFDGDPSDSLDKEWAAFQRAIEAQGKPDAGSPTANARFEAMDRVVRGEGIDRSIVGLATALRLVLHSLIQVFGEDRDLIAAAFKECTDSLQELGVEGGKIVEAVLLMLKLEDAKMSAG